MSQEQNDLNLQAKQTSKRRCVSSACIACRKRKSKCDGNLPTCAACASVYGTLCVYDPASDHRRKGVYKKDAEASKTRSSTLQTLIESILNLPEEDAFQLVRRIRTCDDLDEIAYDIAHSAEENVDTSTAPEDDTADSSSDSYIRRFEVELTRQIGSLRLNQGVTQFLGGTSNLLFLDNHPKSQMISRAPRFERRPSQQEAALSWTTVTKDLNLIAHLLNLYFTWHYTFFTTLSKTLFLRDFHRGLVSSDANEQTHCTPLLVNAMLALGCHFTNWPEAREIPPDSSTAGDHFFKEAKRLLATNEDYTVPRLVNIQALALMSVREAGCGRETRGWMYSGLSFRMAHDLGLIYEAASSGLPEEEVDARRITLWGCFLFDKCWSNYLGRQPQLSRKSITTEKFEVFPVEDADLWSPYTDQGTEDSIRQPGRTRACALFLSSLCEISNDLLLSFYNPGSQEYPSNKPSDLKKLSDLHLRLQEWQKDLPKELDVGDAQLPHVLVMHMFHRLLFIHLFRPFLKHNSASVGTLSPRQHCTQAATLISHLIRIYRATYGLRQICNIVVYIIHSACTIHLLNLPQPEAERDLSSGLRHLHEIGEGWLCARRSLAMLDTQARTWQIGLPDGITSILASANHDFKFSEQLNPAPNTRTFAMTTSRSSTGFLKGGLVLGGNAFNGIETPYPYGQSEPGYTSSYSEEFESEDTVPARTLLQHANDLQEVLPQKGTPLPDQNREAQPIQKFSNPPTSFLAKGMFGGINALFEEQRNWIMQDQSAIFQDWFEER